MIWWLTSPWMDQNTATYQSYFPFGKSWIMKNFMHAWVVRWGQVWRMQCSHLSILIQFFSPNFKQFCVILDSISWTWPCPAPMILSDWDCCAFSPFYSSKGADDFHWNTKSLFPLFLLCALRYKDEAVEKNTVVMRNSLWVSLWRIAQCQYSAFCCILTTLSLFPTLPSCLNVSLITHNPSRFRERVSPNGILYNIPGDL